MTCATGIGFAEALAFLRAEAQPLGAESIPLAEAGGRVLAQAVAARIDAPRYNAAAMDGFAVCDAAVPHTSYRVVGAAYPAEPWAGQLGESEAVRIMTGAAAPTGADRVVPLEVATERDGLVSFPDGWPSARHVRLAGSDIRAGEIVLPVGTLLDPRALLVAAAADVPSVRVCRQPRVSVLALGDELVPPGTAAERDGAIPDSLSQALLLMAREHGAEPAGATLLVDDPQAIRVAAENALGRCDVLLLAGGASRGDRDFSKAGLSPLGLDLRFARVEMKPGKPVWYGRIGHRHVIGLPGNPTAAMTVARLILVPLLHVLGGRTFDGALRWRTTPLTQPLAQGTTRESFLCGYEGEDGVCVLDRQSASAQLLLARANVLVHLPAGTPALAASERISVLSF